MVFCTGGPTVDAGGAEHMRPTSVGPVRGAGAAASDESRRPSPPPPVFPYLLRPPV